MLRDLIRSEVLEGSQVLGKVLDLSRDHRADSKDTAHAERLAEIPHYKHLVPHGINAPGVRATSGWNPSGRSLTALGLPAALPNAEAWDDLKWDVLKPSRTGSACFTCPIHQGLTPQGEHPNSPSAHVPRASGRMPDHMKLQTPNPSLIAKKILRLTQEKSHRMQDNKKRRHPDSNWG